MTLYERGQLDRDDVAISYVNLIESLIGAGRLTESKSVYKTAEEKGFAGYFARLARTIVAAIENSPAELDDHLKWFEERNEEHAGIDVRTGVAAFKGQWRKAKELSKEAIDLALNQDENELAAGYLIDQALRIVFWSSAKGLPTVGDKRLLTVLRTQIGHALRLARSKPILSLAALAMRLRACWLW